MQVTWHDEKHSIFAFNNSPWSSLIAKSTRCITVWSSNHFKNIYSQSFIRGVIIYEIKHTQWTLVDMLLHVDQLMKNERQALRDTSSSCVRGQNLCTPSLIASMALNGDDSHPSVSSELFLKDEEANQKVTPKYSPFITLVLRWKGCSQMFWAIKLFRHINPWTSCFFLLLDLFPRWRSVCKRDFVERI